MINDKKTLENAKSLRKNMTPEERILWKIFRNKNFYGFKFRRQTPIGIYIVDFLCINPKVIIELDGGQHNESDNIRYDKKRTMYLESQGYKVLRFWNNDIHSDIDGVCEKILMVLKDV